MVEKGHYLAREPDVRSSDLKLRPTHLASYTKICSNTFSLVRFGSVRFGIHDGCIFEALDPLRTLAL